MSAGNDGGPAFPVEIREKPHHTAEGLPIYTHKVPRMEMIGGMSLRDWFAGQAPPCPDRDRYEVSKALKIEVPFESKARPPYDLWVIHWKQQIDAIYRYQYADAMLAAREVKP